jgi:hypothetical protein
MQRTLSWAAFLLFYIAMLIVISVLDLVNSVLVWPLWLTQIGLTTAGVAIFAVIGWRWPAISPQASVIVAFTVGILTIVPATLMGLRSIPNLWPQYFLVALGMSTGSMLGFAFVHLFSRKSGDG